MTKDHSYEDPITKRKEDLGEEMVKALQKEAHRQGRSLFSLLGDAVITYSKQIIATHPTDEKVA